MSLEPGCADPLVSCSRYRGGSQERFGHAGLRNLDGGLRKTAIICSL